jgi:hypothetical protein
MSEVHFRLGVVRIGDEIDDELRLLAAVRRSICERDGERSSRQVDQLPDERGLNFGG